MQKEDQKKPTLKQVDEAQKSPATEPLQPAWSQNSYAETEKGITGLNAPEIEIDDRYEVLEKIGEGGMGTVYKVKDRVLEKVFAVKIVKSDLLKDNTAMKRFEQEAQGAIALTHPNLVSVYGHKMTRSGQPFLLMDYHEGCSLSDLLNERSKLLPDQAVELFVQLSDALVHAHAKGIIHRDLKPSNVIIEENEMGKIEPRIVDFGISKILNSNITTMGFTKEQQIFGSPHYMSPEMCRGDKLDARSDIYSLGCVMFEVLEGKPPYRMENPFQTLMQHVSGEKPKFSQPSAVPQPLQGIVLKCLEKDPADRYQSMEQLRRDLERFKQGQKLDLAKPLKPMKFKKAHLGIATGAILCFIAGMGLTSLFEKNSPAPVQEPVPAPAIPAEAIPPAPSRSSNSDGILTWNLPAADPNNPESLIRRLQAADAQSEMRNLMSSRDVSYEQRRLREEAARVLQKNTQAELVAMGEKVVPTVLNHLFDEGRLVRACCFGVIKDLGAVAAKPAVEKIIKSGRGATDYQAAELIAGLGKPAIQELMGYIRSSPTSDTQARALQFLLIAITRGTEGSNLDTADIPVLTRIVQSNSDTSLKRLALLSLATMSDRTEEVRKTFVEVARSAGDTDLRVAAISGLGAIANMESAESSLATQAILAKFATSDKDAYIRFAATANLAALGIKAQPMLSTMTRLTKDRDAAVSMAAKTGLAIIGGASMSGRRSLGHRDAPTFIGEINSSITKDKLAEKIASFGGVTSNASFVSFPTHPDFCGFAVPTLMNYIETSGDRFFDKRYGYEVLGKLGHYSGPSTAWIVVKSSREAERSNRHDASRALLSILGINQR